jgi:hypothetical protein
VGRFTSHVIAEFVIALPNNPPIFVCGVPYLATIKTTTLAADYSLTEIALFQHTSVTAVFYSLSGVLKKIKNIF